MEKDSFFSNEGHGIPQAWSSIFGMEMESQASELNCSSEQIPNCFFNRNWDNSMDQSDPFESALSSIVSSPVNSHPGIPIPGCSGENVVLKELIGRLGSICNSGEISPQSCVQGNNSANTSCYNTPLNSPPKLNLSIMDHRQIQGNLPIPMNHQLPLAPFPADPGFVERAARFSCFGGKSFGVKESEFPHMVESGKLSRVSSNQSFKTTGSQFVGIQEEKDGIAIPIPASDKKFSRLSMSLTSENKELDTSMEESSLSEQIPGGEIGLKGQNTNSNGRKRKAIPKGKGKETQFCSPSAKDNMTVGEQEKEESDAKRSKPDEEAEKEKEKGKVEGNGNGNGNQKQTKETAKQAEPPKDYIHVRARRGQATDSHSLAERVRREKISERMKFLQDLVPGCNKVTGKAVMLDEIINYVQSLQRQVEFLSMKLATVNPRTDMNLEALLSTKDTFQRASMSNTMSHMDASAQTFYGMIADGQEHPLMAMMHRNSNMKSDGFGEAMSFWENDLQSVVQMGFGQNQAQSFHGTMGVGQMKVEL